MAVVGRILLVSSSGGVLLDLLAMEAWWSRYEVTWAAVRAPDTESALRRWRVEWLPERRASRPAGLAIAAARAWRIVREVRPHLIVSAGSGVAVPFFAVAKPLGVPAVWVSTLNVIETPGIAARACGRLASLVLHQQRRLIPAQPGVYIGELY